MVALTDMSPDIAATVRFMIRHRKPDAFFSVPSMYRHLANWPAVAPALETIAGKLMDMVVDSFSRNIPELIVIGAVLRQAFADEAT